ncbi:hypothetical protein [Levilactobacillus brevis]|uniref:hypothetical protein n=1 Tax=Levilactobacillus brevis TaxID=1580 RepID=UPI00339CB2FD
MNKVVKMTVTAMTVLLMGGTVSTTASAATWHKGVPKAIRNKTYLMGKTKGDQDLGYVGYTFKNHDIYIAHSMDGGHMSLHLKYKKVGSKSYYIKGHDSYSKDRLKVKVINSKKIKVADLDNGLYKGYIPYKYYGKNFPSIH